MNYLELIEKQFKGKNVYRPDLEHQGGLCLMRYFQAKPMDRNDFKSQNYSFLSANDKNFERLAAMSELMNVAEYLNEGNPGRIFFVLDENDTLTFREEKGVNFGTAGFSTFETAMKAIDILGKERIETALRPLERFQEDKE